MRNPKYHLYLTHDERRTVINSLICLKNDLISQGRYTDAVDELIVKLTKERSKESRLRRSKLWQQPLHIQNRAIIFFPI